MDTRTLRYIIEFDAKYAAKMERVLQRTRKATDAVDGSMRRASASSKNLSHSFTGLAKRAFLVIPVWLALRNVFLAFINTIREGVQHLKEFDKAMARALAVTHGVKDMAKFTEELRTKIRNLSIDTGESVDKIAEAYYRFGTAGHGVEVSLAGMGLAIKAAIAVMGDSTQTARTMADVYNLMRNNIKGAIGVHEKMQKIASTIAVLWAHNAFELNEFNTALARFTGVAKNYNLTMDELMSLLAASHTLMQRGGTAGAQLSRTFMMMTSRIKRVEVELGRLIDLKSERIFDVYLELLRKINVEYADSALKMKVLNDIFGMKGMRVTGSFAANLGKVVEELERLQNLPLGERMKKLNELFELQMNTIDRQLKRFRELKQVTIEAFVMGVTGAANFVDALKTINDYMENNLIPRAMFFGITMRRIFESLAKAKDVVSGKATIESPTKKMGEIYAKKYFETQPGSITAPGTELPVETSFKKDFLGPFEQAKAGGDVVKMMKMLVVDLGMAESEAKKFLNRTEEVTFEMIKWQKGVTTATGLMEKLSGQTKVNVSETEKMAALYIMMKASLAYQLLESEKLTMFGFSQVQIEQDKLDKMIAQKDQLKNQEDIVKQMLKLQKAINAEAIKFSGQLQGAFQNALAGILKGESSLKEAFKDLSKSMSDIFADMFAGQLTRVLAATGVFAQGGGMAAGIMGALGGVQSKIYIAFVTGGDIAAAKLKAALVTGAKAGTAGGGAAGDKEKGPGLMQYGMSAAMGAIAGAGGGGGVAGGIMGGVGGALMMIPGWGQIAGMALMMGSSLMGKMKSKTEVTESQRTLQITSRINVTNKKLDIVNRNLVELKNTMETYLLPGSAYFAEKRNIEDQYSLHARRGLV